MSTILATAPPACTRSARTRRAPGRPGPVDPQERRGTDPGAQLSADRRAVGRVLRVVADLRLAEPSVMVGDGHDIQRHAQLCAHAAVVVQQGFAAAVAVRRRGIVPVAVGIRVERSARVDVQIAEVRRALVRRRDSLCGCCRGCRRRGGSDVPGDAGCCRGVLAARPVGTGRGQSRDRQGAATPDPGHQGPSGREKTVKS